MWFPSLSELEAYMALGEHERRYREAKAKEFKEALRLQSLQYSVKPRRAHCPSCGSREFRQHAGRSVCSYCRSES